MKKILIVIGIIIFVWMFLRFVIGGPEDDWICVDGQWEKHGVPSAPMPEGECELKWGIFSVPADKD